MPRIEAVLAARAEALGVETARICTGEFENSAEDISLQAGGRLFRGRWLAGADAADSVVRKAARIAFAGTEPEFTGYSLRGAGHRSAPITRAHVEAVLLRVSGTGVSAATLEPATT
ncbi:Oxygenase [Agrobacterium tumefaciens]|uniref:hypothetical protein n=1 Tax=Agrobacterium tumefaciens TaxID=358 RepID=UPI001ADCAF44|nr:hypothetical protein [Agrobacterium tumefaciens]QTK82971.1 Oxygenase [Agrobacterium tumefaciens]